MAVAGKERSGRRAATAPRRNVMGTELQFLSARKKKKKKKKEIISEYVGEEALFRRCGFFDREIREIGRIYETSALDARESVSLV